MTGDLSEAPVPDPARLALLSVGWRPDGVVEVFGPPAAVLSLARWLRAPGPPSMAVRGPRRADIAGVLGAVVLDLSTSTRPHVRVEGDALVLAGTAEALVELAGAFEVVGVGALDLRWAPVERRRHLRPRRLLGSRGSDDAAGVDLVGDTGDDGDDEGPWLDPGSTEVVVAAAYPLEGDAPPAGG